MKLITKAGLLIFLLAIPVLIYVFLQLFGENYYSIPVFYKEGFEKRERGCDPVEGQHYVNLPAGTAKTALENKITVISFLQKNCDEDCQLKFNQLARFSDIFREKDSVQVISFILPDSLANNNNNIINQLDNRSKNDPWHFINVQKEEIGEFIECELLVDSDTLAGERVSQKVVSQRFAVSCVTG